jgi:hypothetical protein
MGLTVPIDLHCDMVTGGGHSDKLDLPKAVCCLCSENLFLFTPCCQLVQ